MNPLPPLSEDFDRHLAKAIYSRISEVILTPGRNLVAAIVPPDYGGVYAMIYPPEPQLSAYAKPPDGHEAS